MSDRRRRIVQFVFGFVLVGVLLSQYHPLFGDPKVIAAEPWTPLKKTIMGYHMLIFAGVGLAVGWVVARQEDL